MSSFSGTALSTKLKLSGHVELTKRNFVYTATTTAAATSITITTFTTTTTTDVKDRKANLQKMLSGMSNQIKTHHVHAPYPKGVSAISEVRSGVLS